MTRNGVSYFIDDLDQRDGVFASLWAIKVLAQAAKREIPLAVDFYPQLQKDITGLLAYIKTLANVQIAPLTHKDMALALHLQYQLHGRLEPDHLEILRKLIEAGEASNGLWEVNLPDMREAVPEFWAQGFLPYKENLFRNKLIRQAYLIFIYYGLQQIQDLFDV